LRQILTVRIFRVAYGQRAAACARAEWGEFGLGRLRLWRFLGSLVGEKHVGGEFVGAAAGNGRITSGDSAGRGGYRPNGCRAASPHAWEWRVDCFFKSRRWRCIRRFESVSRLAKFCARMGRWASESALRGCENSGEGFLRGYRAHLFFLPS